MGDLFPSDYIDAAFQKTLPQGFVIRPLNVNDYEKGRVSLAGMVSLSMYSHASRVHNGAQSFDGRWQYYQGFLFGALLRA